MGYGLAHVASWQNHTTLENRYFKISLLCLFAIHHVIQRNSMESKVFNIQKQIRIMAGVKSLVRNCLI
jgi:hypothetical protein